MSTEVGAGFLADDVGVPIRSIQWWTDLTALRALPETTRRGRGKHRVYNASPPLYGERSYARIAAELNRLRLPIGLIVEITTFFRADVVGSMIHGRGENSLIARALQGEPVIIGVRGEDIPDLHITIYDDEDRISFKGVRSGHVLNVTEILRDLVGENSPKLRQVTQEVT